MPADLPEEQIRSGPPPVAKPLPQAAVPPSQKAAGFLGWIEWAGNKLSDPAMLGAVLWVSQALVFSYATDRLVECRWVR